MNKNFDCQKCKDQRFIKILKKENMPSAAPVNDPEVKSCPENYTFIPCPACGPKKCEICGLELLHDFCPSCDD